MTMTLPRTAATPSAEQALRDVAAEAATDEDGAEQLYRRLIRETGL